MADFLNTVMTGIGEAILSLFAHGLVLGILALVMVAGALPIYFILKKITGSQTTFSEDLREYLTARPQPQPEALKIVSRLDSAESIILQVYKYVLVVGLILGSVFIVWFFINVQNESERSFLRLYFGGAYLFLVVWVVGSIVVIQRRRARRATDRLTQATSPVPQSVIGPSPAPPPAVGGNAAPKDIPADSSLTPQQIVIVVIVFVFAVGTFSVIFLMLRGLP